MKTYAVGQKYIVIPQTYEYHCVSYNVPPNPYYTTRTNCKETAASMLSLTKKRVSVTCNIGANMHPSDADIEWLYSMLVDRNPENTTIEKRAVHLHYANNDFVREVWNFFCAKVFLTRQLLLVKGVEEVPPIDVFARQHPLWDDSLTGIKLYTKLGAKPFTDVTYGRPTGPASYYRMLKNNYKPEALQEMVDNA